MNKKNYIADILTEANAQWLVVLSCTLVFAGFVCSRALASIGMAGIIAVTVLYYGVRTTFKEYFKTRELVVLSLYFWLVFISGIYSDDKVTWLNWVRIKLPYLFLPLAFAPLKKLDNKKLVAVLYGFIASLFISSCVVLVKYAIDYNTITDSFNRGNAMWMPFSHIRYALMLAFAFFCCFYLIQKKYWLVSPAEKWLQIFIAVFIFIALHIMAVRSALLAFYLVCFYLAVVEIISRKRIVAGVALLVLIIALPYAAINFIPSLNHKMNYMRYDLQEYKAGNVNDYSDGQRLLSMKIGLEIWEQHMLLGVGAGDLMKVSDDTYVKEYPQIEADNRRVAHNQFIWVLASTGVFGLLMFLAAFFYPLVVKGYYKHWLFVALNLIIFSSFFTEHTLEEQVGTGFYIIFLLLLMNFYKPE